MLDLLNQSSGSSVKMPNNFNQIKNMMNVVKNARNPQMMLQNMLQQNPQIRTVMQYVNKNGGDPKAAFYALAKEKGVNPEEIISMLNN